MASQRMNEQTYYEILEVQPGALQNEIHAAYQRARAAYSPDSPALYTMFTPEEAKELLKLIEEAYQTLSNQGLRQQYDKKLLQQKNPPTADELPDFDPDVVQEVLQARKSPSSPSRPVSTPSAPSSRPSPSTPVPEGFKKTRYSIYEVDENFEEEIRQSEEFDGHMLARIRQYKRINLEQMSQETRISKTYLSAVESNDYSALPAPVFVRGFVVQVARILNLDDRKVADSYMKLFRQHRLE